MPLRFLLICLMAAPAVAVAAPQISIGAMYDYMDGERSTLAKRVRNQGDNTAFVKVSISELVYDTQGNSREVPVDAALGADTQSRGLIASPARLIIPASGMQALRLLYLGERDRERYYRIRFQPVLPSQGDNFGLSGAESQAYRDSLSAGVNVLAGYGGIVFVHPANATFSADVDDSATHFRISNSGTATVVLDHFNDCTVDGKQCAVPSKYHVRPGSERVFEKAPGRQYRFDLIEGSRSRPVVIAG